MVASVHPTVARVTDRIRERSEATRTAYLSRIRDDANRTNPRERMSCSNLAHAFAVDSPEDRHDVLVDERTNIGIVTTYNDMLSAHRPYENYPELIRDEARKNKAHAQVAGGAPAMCDGVTQGMPGMEMSLFSRDVIAMGTAVALSHDVYDTALLLGICDKIAPGLLIGALSVGHLPCVFVPSGPMGSGIKNAKKSKVRERFISGQTSREEMQDVEFQAYHSAGTCTFYGTANSNQVALEAMGLHVPGSAFVPPYAPLREALTREAVRTAVDIRLGGDSYTPIGELVDERSIVNALVTLVATGGSTNLLIHWVAVARAAGIIFDWSDVDDLSKVVPLLAKIYPNGPSDINDFENAGGTGFILRELAKLGLLHEDVVTVRRGGIQEHMLRPVISDDDESSLSFISAPEESPDEDTIRTAEDPFASTGGLALLKGNLGRSVIKISAVKPKNRYISAPAFVADRQEDVTAAFQRGELNRNVVVVVRFQGPAANGMPELHKLTAVLGALQRQGYSVALVTDGRMSGASGRIPAAIHLTPEAAKGGPCAKLRTGDHVTLDAENGILTVDAPAEEFEARENAELTAAGPLGLGRDLFAGMRHTVLGAEQGACSWLPFTD